MSPITSFTASLCHNGLIDVFAVSDPGGTGVTVWRARQQTAGGHWSAWASEKKPGNGAAGLLSVLDAEKHGHVLAVTQDGPGPLTSRNSESRKEEEKQLMHPPRPKVRSG